MNLKKPGIAVLRVVCLLWFAIIGGMRAGHAAEIIHSLTPYEPYDGMHRRAQHLIDAKIFPALNIVLVGDRFEYWQDDPAPNYEHHGSYCS